MAPEPRAGLLHGPVGRHVPTLIDLFLRVQPHPQIHTARRGKAVIREDDFADHAMLLLEGWVAFSKMLPDGESQIIDILLPGDFALIGVANAPMAAFSVETLSDARFINIGPGQVNGPEPEMARLRELMAAEIVRMQSRTSELLLRVGKGSAANRIAYALLEFFVRLEAVGMTSGTRFAFPMTQHKLGEFTGMSNVHVNRTLRRFEREGIVAYPAPPEIDLCDIDALCALAGLDLASFRNEIIARRAP